MSILYHFLLELKKLQFLGKKEMSLKQSLGARLKQARTDKHMTQKEVAEKLGMLQPAYARYESGKTELDYEKLVFLCNLFEITPNDLYGF